MSTPAGTNPLTQISPLYQRWANLVQTGIENHSDNSPPWGWNDTFVTETPAGDAEGTVRVYVPSDTSLHEITFTAGVTMCDTSQFAWAADEAIQALSVLLPGTIEDVKEGTDWLRISYDPRPTQTHLEPHPLYLLWATNIAHRIKRTVDRHGPKSNLHVCDSLGEISRLYLTKNDCLSANINVQRLAGETAFLVRIRPQADTLDHGWDAEHALAALQYCLGARRIVLISKEWDDLELVVLPT